MQLEALFSWVDRRILLFSISLFILQFLPLTFLLSAPFLLLWLLSEVFVVTTVSKKVLSMSKREEKVPPRPDGDRNSHLNLFSWPFSLEAWLHGASVPLTLFLARTSHLPTLLLFFLFGYATFTSQQALSSPAWKPALTVLLSGCWIFWHDPCSEKYFLTSNSLPEDTMVRPMLESHVWLHGISIMVFFGLLLPFFLCKFAFFLSFSFPF